ncbi:MAG: hypothetical protein AB7N54_20230 [Alphaproteobacteria bacterium]
MFNIDDRPQFDWPVTICIPADGGQHVEKRITGRFRVVPREEFDSPLLGLDAATDRAALAKVVVGWGATDIGDAAGQPLPPTPENIRRVLGIDYVRNAFAAAYGEAITGRPRKNSPRPPAGG